MSFVARGPMSAIRPGRLHHLKSDVQASISTDESPVRCRFPTIRYSDSSAKVVQIGRPDAPSCFPIVEFCLEPQKSATAHHQAPRQRDTLAAHVYDKDPLPRLITRRWKICVVLRELCNRLVPFNYVVPGHR